MKVGQREGRAGRVNEVCSSVPGSCGGLDSLSTAELVGLDERLMGLILLWLFWWGMGRESRESIYIRYIIMSLQSAKKPHPFSLSPYMWLIFIHIPGYAGF